MYRERDFSPSSSPRTLPRPGRGKSPGRSRAKSPVVSQRSHHNFSHQRLDSQRPHLSLLLCPEFEDDFSIGYTSPSSPSSCSPALGRRFPHQQERHHATSLPRPHALARARGAELLQTCASLPCSPTLTRLGGGRREQVGRELSLPSSPLPRIQIVHCDAQVRYEYDDKKVHCFGLAEIFALPRPAYAWSAGTGAHVSLPGPLICNLSSYLLHFFLLMLLFLLLLLLLILPCLLLFSTV